MIMIFFKLKSHNLNVFKKKIFSRMSEQLDTRVGHKQPRLTVSETTHVVKLTCTAKKMECQKESDL